MADLLVLAKPSNSESFALIRIPEEAIDSVLKYAGYEVYRIGLAHPDTMPGQLGEVEITDLFKLNLEMLKI